MSQSVVDTSLMSVKDLCVASHGTPLCEKLTLDITAGECIGILGPNGSGKTSLLHTLTGLQKPRSGEICLQGKKLHTLSQTELAQKAGLLFQSSQDEMPATVIETVMLGRLPHQRAWQSTSEEDWQICTQAIEHMNLCDMAHKDISRLSGGERQRVAIAGLLAQSPLIYFLDEPTNHLDVSFQIKTMQLLDTTVKQQKRAMMMATHDINLAARFCDRILLLTGQGHYVLGPADEVLTEALLTRAFAFDIYKLNKNNHSWFFPAGFERK